MLRDMLCLQKRENRVPRRQRLAFPRCGLEFPRCGLEPGGSPPLPPADRATDAPLRPESLRTFCQPDHGLVVEAHLPVELPVRTKPFAASPVPPAARTCTLSTPMPGKVRFPRFVNCTYHSILTSHASLALGLVVLLRREQLRLLRDSIFAARAATNGLPLRVACAAARRDLDEDGARAQAPGG